MVNRRTVEVVSAKPLIRCNQCIQSDIRLQVQQMKIDQLKRTCKERQNKIRHLKSQLDIYKLKLKRLEPTSADKPVNNEMTGVLEMCSVCQSYNLSSEYHICNGQEEISCEYCEESFTTTSSLVEHLNTHHAQKNFHKCDKCSNIFAMALLLEFHSKRHVSVEQSDDLLNDFQCGFCGKSFCDVIGLQNHKRNIHDKAIGQFECFLCKLKFTSLYDTRKHLKLHKRSEKCVVCNKIYTKKELEEHLCSDLKVINCAYCNQSFRSTKNLLKHLEESCKKDRLIYKCDSCSKYFPMEIIRDLHSDHHKVPSKTYMCDMCPKLFASAYQLKKHKKRH